MNVVAVGSGAELSGFALTGVRIVHAPTADDAVRAWRSLDADVGLVILSAAAAQALDAIRDERPDTLVTVVP